jgi:integrase
VPAPQRGFVIPRGKGFQARWTDENSRQRAKNVRTKTEGREFLKDELARIERRRGGEVTVDRAKTVNELLDRFLTDWPLGIGTKNGKAPEASTVKKNRQVLKHARSTFGTRDPRTLTRLEIERWHRKLSKGVRHDVLRIFRQALAWGVVFGLLESDPTAGISNPRPRQDERKEVFPFASMAQVEAVATELDARYQAIPIVLAGTGLRPEELFGLHRSDLDLDKRLITVRRRYSGGALKDGTKTGKRERIVPFGQKVYEALKAMTPRIDTPILFPAPRGKYIDIEKFRHREWAPALRAAGIKHRRIYDCRHSFITWALTDGIPVSRVAKIAGTSVTQIEATYDRWIPSQNEYAKILDNLGAAAVGQ